MTAFLALLRKHLIDSRWLLGLSALALFGLGWLFVYVTHRIEVQAKRDATPFGQVRRMGFAAIGGPAVDGSSTSFEVALWRHPFVVLIVCMWPIARGSLAVGGEIERGTMDLMLSRPVSRTSYLASQVVAALIGLVILAAALVAGNQLGNRYNVIDEPPGIRPLLRPALGVIALGVALYGYSLFLSAIDLVRWRPNLFASALTMVAFIAQVVANIPSLENWKWIERYSVFRYYDPVDAALKAQGLASNVAVLGTIGLIGVVLAFLAFAFRDLPTSG
jgi:ABC-2 type transport system permease protein